jgi:hypothetical protein
MSYVNYDHAGWVQTQIECVKRQKPTAREARAAREHKGWYAAPDALNPFQRRAFDILGIVGNGIYNCPISWDNVHWAPNYIVVSWRGCFATWDFQGLTRFVFLCHEARIRGELSPSGPGRVEVALHERVADGDISRRHPNLTEAIDAFRQEMPVKHPIMYREPEAAE